MNTTKIRHDILTMMGKTGIKASRLAKISGVETSSLYNFLNRKASLHAESLLKLWPYVYEAPVPLAESSRVVCKECHLHSSCPQNTQSASLE